MIASEDEDAPLPNRDEAVHDREVGRALDVGVQIVLNVHLKEGAIRNSRSVDLFGSIGLRYRDSDRLALPSINRVHAIARVPNGLLNEQDGRRTHGRESSEESIIRVVSISDENDTAGYVACRPVFYRRIHPTHLRHAENKCR